jgi:hypothetical protein
MASGVTSANPATLSTDPKILIQYALLVLKAESAPPAQTMYHPGDVIDVAYDTLDVRYTLITTFYGNDLATEINPGRAQQIVSFGFVVQDNSGNVVISIRGTEGTQEWLQDAKFLPIQCPILAGSGFTEDGFTAVYRSLRITPDPASKRLVEALPDLPFPQPVSSVTVCGHSLGGALATLCAFDVAANTPFKNPLVYSYASPRTGNASFVDTYNQLVPRTVRIANRLDIVPKVPTPPDYGHVELLYELNPMLKVKLDLLCQHHLTTYLFLLSLQTGGTILPLNPECVQSGIRF